MRILPQLCFQCSSWFLPKTTRFQRHCCNACRQASYRGRKPYSIKFDLTTCSDEAEAEFMKILGRYENGLEDQTLYEKLEAMRKDNYELYQRFMYNYGKDKFGVSARQFIDGLKADIL